MQSGLGDGGQAWIISPVSGSTAIGWVWIDAGEGFSDQAHFIREFKRFTGMTPKRFMVEAAPVMRLTIERKRLMQGLPKLALYS